MYFGLYHSRGRVSAEWRWHFIQQENKIVCFFFIQLFILRLPKKKKNVRRIEIPTRTFWNKIIPSGSLGVWFASDKPKTWGFFGFGNENNREGCFRKNIHKLSSLESKMKLRWQKWVPWKQMLAYEYFMGLERSP